jgi:hypothetical protein
VSLRRPRSFRQPFRGDVRWATDAGQSRSKAENQIFERSAARQGLPEKVCAARAVLTERRSAGEAVKGAFEATKVEEAAVAAAHGHNVRVQGGCGIASLGCFAGGGGSSAAQRKTRKHKTT